jgi:hypothetical protein
MIFVRYAVSISAVLIHLVQVAQKKDMKRQKERIEALRLEAEAEKELAKEPLLNEFFETLREVSWD